MDKIILPLNLKLRINSKEYANYGQYIVDLARDPLFHFIQPILDHTTARINILRKPGGNNLSLGASSNIEFRQMLNESERAAKRTKRCNNGKLKSSRTLINLFQRH